MNEKDIERLLRDSWRPASPEGMRERTLDRARGQLPVRRPRPLLRALKLAPAFLLVGWTVFVGLADRARDERIAILRDETSVAPRRSTPTDAIEARRQMARLVEMGAYDLALEGDEPL